VSPFHNINLVHLPIKLKATVISRLDSQSRATRISEKRSLRKNNKTNLPFLKQFLPGAGSDSFVPLYQRMRRVRTSLADLYGCKTGYCPDVVRKYEGRSTSEVPCVIKIKVEAMSSSNVAHLFHFLT
jgi:hypothetical protein